VLIWSGEDDPKDTLVPRLLTCGADVGRVWFVGDVRDGGEPQSFDPAVHMPTLERALGEIGGGIDLLIVDPIVNAVAGDSHKNSEVRRGLQPLVTLAAKLDCAVLGISDFTKGTAGRDPVERVTGSIAFAALARVVMAAAKMPDDDHQGGSRIFCRTKNNIGPDDGGYRYDLQTVELEDHLGVMASNLLWGKAEKGSARDLLNRGENLTDDASSAGQESAQMTWLREFLAYREKPSNECMAEGKTAGFTQKQIRTARDKLRIMPVRKGFGPEGAWIWSLPAGTFSADKDAHDPEQPSPTNSRASMDDGGLGYALDEAASMGETSPDAGSSPSQSDNFSIDALDAHPMGVKDAMGINGDWEYF
jgi:putative DNA primase/helicase